MKYINESILVPCPTDELLLLKEKKWRLKLPHSYKEFIKKMNGVKVTEGFIYYNNRKEGISQFFCILEEISNSNGWLDIGVVSAPIIEKLVYDEDRIGIEVLPIAQLDYGNYLVLDYKNEISEPQVCVFDYEESEDFNPVTYLVSNDFETFISSI